jgi:hypothetical protein
MSWIFLSSAYVSIVQDKRNPKHLLVRARRAGDIERTFPMVRVHETTNATEYPFRAPSWPLRSAPRSWESRTRTSKIHWLTTTGIWPFARLDGYGAVAGPSGAAKDHANARMEAADAGSSGPNASQPWRP